MSFPHTMTESLIEQNEHAQSGEETHLNPNNRGRITKDSDDETYNGPSIVIECVKRKKKKKRRSSTDEEDYGEEMLETSSRSSKSSRASSRASKLSKSSRSSRRSKTASPKRSKSRRKLSGSSSSSKESTKSKRDLKRRASLDALTNRHAVLPTETIANGLSDRHLNFESRLEEAKHRRQMVQSSIQNLMAEENEDDDEDSDVEEVTYKPTTSTRTPTVMPLDLEEPTNTAFCQGRPAETPKPRPSLVDTTLSGDRTTPQQRRGLDDWKRHLSFRHILDNYTYNPASFDDHLDEDEVSLGELPEGCEESASTIDLEASRAIETFDEECPSEASDKQANISKFLAAMEPQKRSAFKISIVAIWFAAGAAIVILIVFMCAR